MLRKVLIGIGVLVVILVSAILILFKLAQNAPPPKITANFVELEKIEKISKYRSCAGHTTVPQDKKEMRRNMKHYFWVKKEYLGSNTVKIFSPYDGFVSVIRKDPEEGLEGEIWISPKDMFVILPPIGRWMFSVQHINVREDLRQGSEVKAGELIGYAAVASENRGTFDVVYGKGSFVPKNIDNWMGPFVDLDSVFNQMNGEVFGEYQQRGISSKEDLIISSQTRDQDPCQYMEKGPYFLNQDDPQNWVLL